MAIIGHWFVSFPMSFFLPQASMTLLCKLAMLSDFLSGFLVLLKVETATSYAWYMSTPPPATVQLIEQWKERGQWLRGVDLEPGEKHFGGYAALWPLYLDIPYSHSVELMLYAGVAIAAFMRLRYGISAGYALGIVVVTISHPMLDMIFHDAHFAMGNRAASRVSGDLWQVPYMGPLSFALEVAMAYGGYRLWISTRQPRSLAPEAESSLRYYKKMFWTLAIQHNMASFYILSPSLVFAFSRWAPSLQAFTPAAYWSFVLFVLTMWSWGFALYPIYRIEQLTTAKMPAEAREGGWYAQAP